MDANWYADAEKRKARNQRGHEETRQWFRDTFGSEEISLIDSLWIQQRSFVLGTGIEHPTALSQTLDSPIKVINSQWEEHGELNCLAKDLTALLFKEHRQLAERCISFLLQRDMSPLFAHFYITDLAERFYAEHEIDRTIDYCNMVVSIAPDAIKAFKAGRQSIPFNQSYTRLCIIYEKKLNYDQAIQLATQALSEGWGGDWDRRIQRCTNKKNNVVDSRPAPSKKVQAMLEESRKRWEDWHREHGWNATCTQCGDKSEGNHIKRESIFADTHSKEEAAQLDLQLAVSDPNGAGAWDKRYKVVSDVCNRCWKASQRARRQKSTLNSIMNNLGKHP